MDKEARQRIECAIQAKNNGWADMSALLDEVDLLRWAVIHMAERYGREVLNACDWDMGMADVKRAGVVIGGVFADLGISSEYNIIDNHDSIGD